MNKVDKKKMYKAVDMANQSCVVINDCCFTIDASTSEALALFSMMANQLKEKMDVPEEVILESAKIGLLSEEERLKRATEAAIKMFKNTVGSE